MKKRITVLLLFTLSSLSLLAQYKMRPVEQLINRKEPGWVLVKQWIDSATNKVEVLPVDTIKAKDVLYHTQVTTRSAMGAVIFSTGGILVDNGWIRLLGSGSTTMQRTLSGWNKGKGFKDFGDQVQYFIVADDAIGGCFAVNYGLFGKDAGKIYYLPPNTLEWEPMDMYYEDFVWFCFTGDLDLFYKGSRWSSWKTDIKTLKADEVFHVFPPLWSNEGKDIEKSARKPVPADEQFFYNMAWRKKMGLD